MNSFKIQHKGGSTKRKVVKLDLLKLRTCALQKILLRKWKSNKWEKIFAKHLSNERHIQNIWQTLKNK